MPFVTHILQTIEQGDPRAADQLLVLVYDELRKLAARYLARETPGQTLSATALVHEAYLRLLPQGGSAEPDNGQGSGAASPGHVPWNSRRHFFAAAAQAMRRILVEHARRKKRHKHGGGRQRVALEDAGPAYRDAADELLAIHEALDRLAGEDPEAAQLVQLRYFAGLSVEQAAETLGLPRSTAYAHWSYAKASLRVLLDVETDAFPS